MEQNFYKFQISVDSETGIYWYGERELQTQAQINAIIEQALQKQLSVQHHANRGQYLFHFVGVKFIRKLGNCFRARSFRSI